MIDTVDILNLRSFANGVAEDDFKMAVFISDEPKEDMKIFSEKAPSSVMLRMSDLSVNYPNVKIMFVDIKNPEMMRGCKLSLVIVKESEEVDDEHMKYLLHSVIRPAMFEACYL